MDFAAKSRTPDVQTPKNSKKRKPEIEPEGDSPKQKFEKPTESNENGPLTNLILSSKSGLVDPEGLRQKLQDRIQEMRKIRHADENRKRKEYRLSLEPNLPKKKKQKRTKAPQSSAQIDEEDDEDDEDPSPSSTNSTPSKSNVSLDETDVKFSTFELESGKAVPSYLVKKKKPKKIEVLKETQEKAKLAAQNPELDKKFAYESALKKVKGEKVFSAAVLKKQIKQEKKKKEKSKSQWAKRKSEEAEKFKEKQRQRQQNIQEHIEKRKSNKILKRRKNRPGFEGKKA